MIFLNDEYDNILTLLISYVYSCKVADISMIIHTFSILFKFLLISFVADIVDIVIFNQITVSLVIIDVIYSI
jgi:hypothetical protein